ncbi:uncharacterized protein LOC130112726 [Lampris incognitus]|uniref:uncharacterized protein LOC130112726 n=1 Tax=Lampris incognitus TaxID=2546036 RepID=UPI0024B5624E|nr:uncharacterized protein LOC130112726 [Lampris incognitus]
MTKAALTKVFVLVILAFIICLPEFFTFYRVSKVNFLCTPYQHSEELNPARNGETAGAREEAELTRRGEFDPCLTLESGNQKPFGTRRNWSKGMEVGSNSGGRSDPGVGWFACETDVDMMDLNNDSLLPGLKVTTEVSVVVHVGGEGSSLHLKLYGQVPHSSLHIHPPGERAEEEDHEEDQVQRDFYCCLPVPPTPETTNHSRCLLRLSNETLFTSTERATPPLRLESKGEWWCVFRVLWLALLCVVLLIVITAVLGQVYRQRRGGIKKPEVFQVRGYRASPPSNGSGPSFGGHPGEMCTEMIKPKGKARGFLESHCGLALFPIEEVELSDLSDTVLDGETGCHSCDVTGDYNPKLHHRGHPSSSSCTEEQA